MRRVLLVVLAMVLMVVGLAVPSSAGQPDVVTVVGPSAVGSPDADALVEELSAFGAKKGFDVEYDGYSDPADLIARIEGADPPDVVVAAYPGLLFEVKEHLVDLSPLVKLKKLEKAFGGYLLDSATDDDGFVLGAPIKVDVKSLVWYQPGEFEAAGYAVPETFAELVALSDAMRADGRYPWCNYIESGLATGWLGTDWIEDLLLGAEGPMVYDQWIDHDVLFRDPRVETAFQRYQQMIDEPGYVYDRGNMLTVPFFANAVPLGDRDCFMHRQATFFGAFIDMHGYELGDFATFKFPSVDATYRDAAFGGAVYMAVLDDRKAVEKLTEFMVGKKFGETALAATGFWILPHTDFDHSLYPTDLVRSWAEITQAATLADQFRFDASDMMPSEVGFGTFLTGIVDLVSGAKSVPQVLADIDFSWPT